MASVYCLDCDERIVLNPHVRLGQRLVCPHCAADLEVISVDPPELDWVYDWSYEEDEDKDDWQERLPFLSWHARETDAVYLDLVKSVENIVRVVD